MNKRMKLAPTRINNRKFYFKNMEIAFWDLEDLELTPNLGPHFLPLPFNHLQQANSI